MSVFRSPWVLAIVAVSAAWYWRGSRRPGLRAVGRATRRRAVRWRALCFAGGLVVILIALDSPLEPLADDYFWAHMLQHVLLMLVAAPLIVLGAPWLPFWRPLPLGVRRPVARFVLKSPSLRWLRAAGVVVAAPWCAWVLFNADIAAWHVPALYELTLRNDAAHYLEHASFVLLGLLFWSRLLPSPPLHLRLSGFECAIFATAGAAAGWVLAVILALATTPLYPAQHLHSGGALSALGDQQLAAGVMLGPGSLAYSIVVFWSLYAWLAVDEPRRRRRSVPQSALGAGHR
jgi:putative membrane protein